MEDVSDLHRMPLVGHDLPTVSRVKARVSRDPETGSWVWEHECPLRGPQRPFYGLPMPSLEAAFRFAQAHMEFCL
jgi:hypothetical protein